MGNVRKPVRKNQKERKLDHERAKELEKKRRKRQTEERGNTDYRREDEI